MPAPKKILELVATFSRNREEYRAAGFNEAQLRQQFINPMFRVLGWDMDNEQGYAEAYKDVIHEASLRMGEAVKAPDYCFRIGGTPKFYLEAKKPAVNVKDDIAPAYQVRRYGWTKQLPLSILTDFEEFAVYDCRIKPNEKDKASVARVSYLRYEDYDAKWDEIAGTFSRDAILKGSFDKYADSSKAKRGTATVDAVFLEDIESWRLELAKNIALRNPRIEQRELNYAVQITIDRIIFLRMCEARGIEPYGQLRDLMGDDDIYKELCKLYRKADQRYNSGLFHFEKEPGREDFDALTPKLAVDDKVLKSIVKCLYYPERPYEFSVMPAEILGQVYEQFLGKVIRLTAGHTAKVEEKPEVKKAGGVYYTPTYIVDYIVKHTVGKLLGEPGASATGQALKKAAKLSVLDPACGSGSFLLGAYEYLLKWHLDYYMAHGPEHFKKEIVQAPGGWRLTTGERKRILMANLYGVDIDPQAVEVTKLSLLLKVLEGETLDTLIAQERALPDLASNIKCGNSLIGPDFYVGQQGVLFDDEEKYRINVFDWNTGFPAIMKAGGFDAVIGNPPYGALFSNPEIRYLRAKYKGIANSLDSFILFVELSAYALSLNGHLGFIIPSGWASTPSSEPMRRMFLDHYTPNTFVSLPFGVFSDAYIDTIIVTACKKRARTASDGDTVSLIVFPPRFKITSQEDFSSFEKVGNIAAWNNMSHLEFLITCTEQESKLLVKLSRQPKKLSDYIELKRGIETFSPQAVKKGLVNPTRAFNGVLQRYFIDIGPRAYIGYDEEIQESKPQVYFKGDRILLRQVLSRKLRLQAVFASNYYLTNQSVQSLLLKKDFDAATMHVILAVLNSSLISWYFKNINSVARRDDFPKIIIQQTRDLPFCDLVDGQLSIARKKKIVMLAMKMPDLLSSIAAAKTPHEKAVLQAQIDATDRQIDALVYDLYGLTADEIKIVEEATAR